MAIAAKAIAAAASQPIQRSRGIGGNAGWIVVRGARNQPRSKLREEVPRALRHSASG